MVGGSALLGKEASVPNTGWGFKGKIIVNIEPRDT